LFKLLCVNPAILRDDAHRQPAGPPLREAVGEKSLIDGILVRRQACTTAFDLKTEDGPALALVAAHRLWAKVVNARVRWRDRRFDGRFGRVAMKSVCDRLVTSAPVPDRLDSIVALVAGEAERLCPRRYPSRRHDGPSARRPGRRGGL
jgi:hypothetical protein